MQVLTVTDVWKEELDRPTPKVMELLARPPEGIELELVSAGMGADCPALVWRSLTGITVAITILQAPSTIEENWPKWKAIFDTVTVAVHDAHRALSIDAQSAAIIGLNHATTSELLSHENLRVDFAIRISCINGANYSEKLDLLEAEIICNTVDGNSLAARQLCARYVFGLSDDRGCLTVIVENDGMVSFSRHLSL